jgi:tRNA(His) 5'-end guanylyltransferase
VGTSASLGDRIKTYEQAYTHRYPPNQPLVIRVDGRAFHTYTRGMDRPFDHNLMAAMVEATEHTAKDMMGFKLAYTQSDEATFLITDFDKMETQGWFGYEVNKVLSLSASLFTAHFNMAMHRNWGGFFDKPPATFDSRAFVVPMADVPNVFLWRQRDWERNSITMLAQAHFSHKQLHAKKTSDMHDMLHEKGVNWATDLNAAEKNGTFIRRVVRMHESDNQATGFQPYYRTEFDHISEKADYIKINQWITNQENANDDSPALSAAQG